MWMEFLLTSLIVVISPGTAVIYTIGVGMTRGTGASIVAAAGCTFGIIPHMAAAIFGLAALLNTSPLAFQLFKGVGVAYLHYMAWSILRERGALEVIPAQGSKPLGHVALTGGVINILNPKLSIFFLAFLPQFVSRDVTSPAVFMLGLSGIFMAMSFLVFTLYGVFASRLRKHVIERPSVMAWMRRGFAIAFVALGARLMITTI